MDHSAPGAARARRARPSASPEGRILAVPYRRPVIPRTPVNTTAAATNVQASPATRRALAEPSKDRDQVTHRGEDDRGADHAGGPADGALAPEDPADQRLAGLPAHAAAGTPSRAGLRPTRAPRPGRMVMLRRRGARERRAPGVVGSAGHWRRTTCISSASRAHPDAAPATAAERDPGVGAGFLVQDSLRPERVGLRVDVGVVVQEIRVGHQGAGPGRTPAPDRDRLGDQPGLAVGQHRTATERLWIVARR